MTIREGHGSNSPAVSGDEAVGEVTGELSTADLMLAQEAPETIDADEIGPTIACIPIRNELAAARIAHALANAREAQALVDEAVELLATVRGLHRETYQLGAARGAIHETVGLLGRCSREGEAASSSSPAQAVDLKKDPTSEEIAIWMSFGIPVMS